MQRQLSARKNIEMFLIIQNLNCGDMANRLNSYNNLIEELGMVNFCDTHVTSILFNKSISKLDEHNKIGQHRSQDRCEKLHAESEKWPPADRNISLHVSHN
jgi:hypothetical protein